MPATASPRQIIQRIDREIDENRRHLLSKVNVNQLSATSWERAWRLFPELRERDNELFRQRGEAQVERDLHDAQAVRYSRARKSKCPTCGATSYAQAA